MNNKKLKEMRGDVILVLVLGTIFILLGLICYGIGLDYQKKHLVELTVILLIIGFWVYISGIGLVILYAIAMTTWGLDETVHKHKK